MYNSHAKKVHKSYMHGSFLYCFFLCIYVITAWILVTVLNISVKKTEWNLYCIFFYKIKNHVELIDYLKGILNLNKHLSVWALFSWKHWNKLKVDLIKNNIIYFLLLLSSSFFLEWKSAFFWYQSTRYNYTVYQSATF